MKPSIYIDPSGVVRYNLFPEEPAYEHYGLTQDDTEDFWDDVEAHKQALQAAKDSAVRFEDQEQAREIIYYEQHGGPQTDVPWSIMVKNYSDKLFPLPEGYSVEVKNQGVCCSPMPPNISHHGYCDECSGYTEKKVAVLLPTRKELLIEMMQGDEKNGMYEEPDQLKDTQLSLNFWKRLILFVENVKVNDPMSEEEKEMILTVAKQFTNRIYKLN
jgi:hypothetical protein